MSEALVEFVRGLIGFFTLLIFARLLGKQQISQLTFFEYILGITVGSTASSLTTDLTSSAWPHWIGLVTWVFAVLILQLITLKWRYASKYIDGEPTVVVMNGKIMEAAMSKMRYRGDELLEQLRTSGVFDLTEVEFAVLEKSGQLSVLKKSQYQPITPKDMNISTNYKGISTELIYDGVVVEENLNQVGLNKKWLEEKLKSMNINNISDVFLATLGVNGELYVDTYKDKMKNIIDIGDSRGPY